MKLQAVLRFSFLLSLAFAVPILAHAENKPAPVAAPAPSEAVPTPTDAEGQYRLAQACMRGDGVKKDPRKAYDLLKMAADQGHADAIGGLGYFHANGIVVKRDLAEAAGWFRKGAEKGGGKSMVNLGLALAYGRGVPANEAEGVAWIDKAAAQGVPEANFTRGDFFFRGKSGHRLDYQEALRYYLKAAEAGHAGAQNMAGFIYREGFAGTSDAAKAEFWLRKSAEQGDPKAMNNLGDLLFGVEKIGSAKYIEALKWIILSDRAGFHLAKQSLAELSPDIPEAVLNEARKQADEFKPRHSGEAGR